MEKQGKLTNVVAMYRESSAEPEKVAQAGKAFIIQLYWVRECKSVVMQDINALHNY